MNASNVSVAANASAVVSTSEATTEPWYPYVLALYVAESVAVMIGNVLVMVAYWMTPQLQTPATLLIFNLSLIDCAVPLFSVAWIIFNFAEAGLKFVVNDKWACLTTLWTTGAISTASMAAIFFLSLDRFIAVLFPYTYYTVVTEKSVKVANAVAWVFPTVLHIFPLLGFDIWDMGDECSSMFVMNPIYNNLVLSVARSAILISTAIMNIAVTFVAFKKSRTAVGNIPPAAQPSDPPPAIDFKLTKMLLIVVGTFFVTWAPYLGLTVYHTMRRGQVPTLVKVAQDFSLMGVGMNSVLNPLIYARKNEKFRNAFKKILFRRNDVDVIHAANNTPQQA